jgi:uncharacterized protein (DUF433 family)
VTVTYDNLKPYGELIVREPGICGGEPTFRGTRVTLRTVLASLADGNSAELILANFPSLKPADIRAVIAFAAASAEKKLSRRARLTFRKLQQLQNF